MCGIESRQGAQRRDDAMTRFQSFQKWRTWRLVARKPGMVFSAELLHKWIHNFSSSCYLKHPCVAPYPDGYSVTPTKTPSVSPLRPWKNVTKRTLGLVWWLCAIGSMVQASWEGRGRRIEIEATDFDADCLERAVLNLSIEPRFLVFFVETVSNLSVFPCSN